MGTQMSAPCDAHMHCSKETKPQFVPPPLRSRHQGRQVAVWASAGAASMIRTSAIRGSATKRERIKVMPALHARTAELNTRQSNYSSSILHWCDHDLDDSRASHPRVGARLRRRGDRIGFALLHCMSPVYSLARPSYDFRAQILAPPAALCVAFSPGPRCATCGPAHAGGDLTRAGGEERERRLRS